MSAENNCEIGSIEEEIKPCCQAVIHAPQFYDQFGNVIPHFATSTDHFTPRSIAKRLGWKSKDYQDPAEHIPMHGACHALKDASTRARVRLLKGMRNGGSLSLQDYRAMRNRYDLVFISGEAGGAEMVIDSSHGELVLEGV